MPTHGFRRSCSCLPLRSTRGAGIGDVSDPYVRASRAECMLAALVLAEGGVVDFLDEERIEVLQSAPSPRNPGDSSAI